MSTSEKLTPQEMFETGRKMRRKNARWQDEWDWIQKNDSGGTSAKRRWNTRVLLIERRVLANSDWEFVDEVTAPPMQMQVERCSHVPERRYLFTSSYMACAKCGLDLGEGK